MQERKLNRRDFLRLSAVTATGAVIAACAPTAPQIVEVEKPVVVEKEVVKEVPVERVVEKVVTVTPKPVEKAELMCMSGVVDEVWYGECLPYFNERYPHIKVDNVGGVSEEKLIAAFVAGNAPDVFAGAAERAVRYQETGQLLDLTPYMNRDLTQEDFDDWYEEQLGCWRRTEPPVGQFFLPKYAGTLIIFYNVEFFDEEGVDRPPRRWKDAWNYDEYLEAMLKFVKKDASGKIIRWGSWGFIGRERAQMHLNGFGGHFVDPEDNTRCALGDPPAQEALWWLYDRTWKDNSYPQAPQVGDLNRYEVICTGMTAMMEEGAWGLQRITDMCAKIKWNISPFPKGPAKQVTLACTDGYGIWEGTKYPDAAWELEKFVCGSFFGKIQAKTRLKMPSRKSLLTYWYQIGREQYPALEDVDLEIFGDGLLQGYGTIQEFYKDTAGSAEVYNPVFESIYWVGDTTPDVFKNGVCDEITRVNREA